MNTTRKGEKKKQQKKKKQPFDRALLRGGWLLDKIKRRAVSGLSQQSFHEEERYHREAPPLPWQDLAHPTQICQGHVELFSATKEGEKKKKQA